MTTLEDSPKPGALVKRPAFQVFLFLLILTAAKIAVAARIELNSNEAYHWHYAQHLAAGYHNHPPMIGWILWLSTSLFGNGLLGTRLLLILGGSVGVWLTFLAGRRLYDDNAGRLAAFLTGVVPELVQSGSTALPEAPLFLFWTATIWALAHALGGGRPAWWYAAGAFLGLAMLSKYPAIFIGVGVLLFLAASPDHRGWLRRREPYLAVGIALLLFSPTLLWNAGHAWVSFHYQGLSRFERGPGGVVSLSRRFPLTELFHLTPFVAAWMWGAGAWTLLKWKGAPWQDRLVASLGMPLLLFFASLAPFVRIHGHWTAPGYLGGLILSAAVVARGGRWGRRLHVGTIAILLAALLAAPVALAVVPDDWLSGWTQLAGEVRRRSPEFVIAANYHVAAQLGYHLHPTIATDLAPAGRSSQSFLDWWRPEEMAGKNAIIVLAPSDHPKALEFLMDRFGAIEDPETVEVKKFWGKTERFLLVRARDYRPIR